MDVCTVRCISVYMCVPMAWMRTFHVLLHQCFIVCTLTTILIHRKHVVDRRYRSGPCHFVSSEDYYAEGEFEIATSTTTAPVPSVTVDTAVLPYLPQYAGLGACAHETSPFSFGSCFNDALSLMEQTRL